jgi:hypothetical protein
MKKVCGWLKRWDIDFNFVGTFYFLEEFVWYHLLRDLKLKKELAESIIFFRVFFQQTDSHIHTSRVAFTCQVKWRHNACFIDLVWSLVTCLSFSAFLACIYGRVGSWPWFVVPFRWTSIIVASVETWYNVRVGMGVTGHREHLGPPRKVIPLKKY